MAYVDTANTDPARIARRSSTEIAEEISALRTDLREAQATIAAGYYAAHAAAALLRIEIGVLSAELDRRRRSAYRAR